MRICTHTSFNCCCCFDLPPNSVFTKDEAALLGPTPSLGVQTSELVTNSLKDAIAPRFGWTKTVGTGVEDVNIMK